MSDTPTKTAGKRMNPVTAFGLLALASIVAVTAWQKLDTVESAVAWREDYDRALVDAGSDRLVLLNFTSPGCIYCKQMERSVFPRDDVQAALAGFITVKVNAWREQAFAQRYFVSGLPSYIVVDGSGKALVRVDGYQEPEQFIAFLQAARPSEG